MRSVVSGARNSTKYRSGHPGPARDNAACARWRSPLINYLWPPRLEFLSISMIFMRACFRWCDRIDRYWALSRPTRKSA